MDKMHVTRVGLCSALVVAASCGADITWDGSANGQNGKNWGDPDAWAGGAVPGTGDNAVFAGIAAYNSPPDQPSMCGSNGNTTLQAAVRGLHPNNTPAQTSLTIPTGGETVTGSHSPVSRRTLAGLYAAGAGAPSITGDRAMGGVSIFTWDVTPKAADSGTATSQSITGAAVFKVLERRTTDTFWKTARSWAVYRATPTTGTFGSFGNDGGAFKSSRTIAAQAPFDLSHSTGGVSMSWTPAPEVSNLLAGALLAGGLLRRNRRWVAAV